MASVLLRVVDGLNDQQRKAVLAPNNGQLQIIAGPGTGKTKVLVARVAYLLLHDEIPPQNIIVTTFTKKAANEMTERLAALLRGTGIEIDRLLIGTFHSICYRIIKIYGKKVGLQDHNIADERDSLHVMKDVLEGLTGEDLDYLEGLVDESKLFKTDAQAKNNGYDPKKIRQQVSKLKSGGFVPEEYAKSASHNRFLSYIYARYQDKLAQEKLLDFDDCLLHCYLLVTKHPVLNFVRHTLVDEFQDTNEIQLRLMYQFARGHPTEPRLQNNVTIVGDPDQSIYAFRDAQSANFEKMKARYPGCAIITLNQNYRSTSDILNFSETIMRQQNNRVLKSLQSQHTSSYKPVYANLNSSEEEARWIAYQIEHLLTLPQAPFKYSDVAILVRTAYQTRVLENEFVRKRIPYLMVKGKAFWERKEVLAIMDYLRVVAHDNDRIAVLRTINLPKRGIGEKTLALIDNKLELAQISNISALEGLRGVVADSKAKLTAKNREAITEYLAMVEQAKETIRAAGDVGAMDEQEKAAFLTSLFTSVYASSGLKKEYQNDQTASMNLSEVQSQFCEFAPKDEQLPLFIGGEASDMGEDGRNFVARFIHSVGLYETDSGTSAGEEDPRGRVSISTIHGSKGLEWPVVFVPGLSEGLMPAKFALDSGGNDAVNEERRCFYVATTRARVLLYLSSYTEKNASGNWGRRPVVAVSRFLSNISPNVFNKSQKAFSTWDDMGRLYRLLGGECPAAGSFDLGHFVQLYEARSQSYVKGQDHAVGAYFQGQRPSNSNGLGFTSAKVEMERKRVVQGRPGGFKAPRRSVPGKAPGTVERAPPTATAPAAPHRTVLRAPSGPRPPLRAPTAASPPPPAPARKAPPYIPSRPARKT